MRDGRLLGLRSPGALHTLVEDDAVLVRWLPLLDGSRSLASIAELSGVPLTTVREVALDLYAAGLLAEAEPSEVEVPALVFYDHARASGLIWAETTALPSGSHAVAIRALVEHWHYVRTAPARLLLAARSACIDGADALWRQLATEEASWAHALEDGLRHALAPDELHPLPATVALCDQMRDLAISPHPADQLGYAACVATALQAEVCGAGLLAYYHDLHAVPRQVLQPFLAYAEFQAARAQSDPIRALFAAQPPLPWPTRTTVLEHLARHVQALGRFHRESSDVWTTPLSCLPA